MYVCLSVVRVVCCQVEVSATGRSLVQRSPTECGVSKCDREASPTRRSWPTGDVEPWEKKLNIQSVPRSKHSVSVIKSGQLMLYREIIAVCSQIQTKHINTLCGQNVELLNVKLVVHIVTTGL